MQYMALIYTDPSKAPAYGTPEFAAYVAGYNTATAAYRKDGAYVAGDALKSADTATTVRLRNGKVETMDGPFAESKEQLGGYYIFECADLDAAIRYAAMIPGAAIGAVEVRPVMSTAM